MSRPSHLNLLIGLAAAFVAVGFVTGLSTVLGHSVVSSDFLLVAVGLAAGLGLSKKSVLPFGLGTWILWVALDVLVYRRPVSLEMVEVAGLVGLSTLMGFALRTALTLVVRRSV